MTILKKLGLTMLVLAIMLAGLGISARPALASSCTQWHYVSRGETLAKIARWYGTTWTYLAQINHLKNPNKIYAGTYLCVSTSGGNHGGKPAKPAKIPTFSIYSVVRNKEVTIYTYNFPKNMKFDVFMGPYGSQGHHGWKVGSFNSGKGGSFYAGPFKIPAELKGDYRIAIRTQNKPSGYFSYNWFYNNTAVDP